MQGLMITGLILCLATKTLILMSKLMYAVGVIFGIWQRIDDRILTQIWLRYGAVLS